MSDTMDGTNSGTNSEPIPARRKRGNPNLRKGAPSLNPSGRPKVVDRAELEALRARVEECKRREAEREAAVADAEGGAVTAARMRKVLGQVPAKDCGPTEQRLREWLTKDGVGKFDARIRELEAEEDGIAAIKAENKRLAEENAELRKQLASEDETEDEGSARATAQLDQILAAMSEKYTAEQEQFVKDGLCACCGQKPIRGQGEAGRVIDDATFELRVAKRAERLARRDAEPRPVSGGK